MIFQILAEELNVKFTCFLTFDGDIFIKGSDVARTMGYQNSSGVLNLCHLTVTDIAPEGLSLPPSLAKTRIFGLEDANTLLDMHPGEFQSLFQGPIEILSPIECTFNIRRPIRIKIACISSSNATMESFIADLKISMDSYLQSVPMDSYVFGERYGDLELGYFPKKIKVLVGNKPYFYKSSS